MKIIKINSGVKGRWKQEAGSQRAVSFYAIFLLILITSLSYRVNAQAVGPGNVQTVIPSGGFAIDGDLQANTPTGGIGDWLKGPAGSGGFVMDSAGNPLNPATTFHLKDAYGSNDNTFGGGLKADQDPNAWSWVLGSSNAKTDINNVLIHLATDAKGHQWVFVAADRSSNAGTAWLDFEFLQNTLTVNSNGTFTSLGPNGGRTAGDFELTFSTGGTFTLQSWQLSGSTYDYVTYSAPAGSVYGANNAAAVPVSFGAFGSTTYAAGTFTEGAVDITALLGTFNPCIEIGIKSIFVKSKTSASATASIMDFVNPLQVSKLQFGIAVAGPNQALCSQGASTSFTLAGSASSSPGDTLSSTTWSVKSGTATIINPSSVTTTVQVSSASATLLLTANTKSGCMAMDSIVLTVNPTPTASISGPSSVCSSTSVTLTSSTNATNPSYIWSPGNATTSSITVPLGSSTTYSVTITAGNGCSATSPGHTVSTNPGLVVSISPPALTLCEGTSGTLCVNSSGSSLTYLWSNGLKNQCFIATVPKTYSVTVTDGNTGCTGTASAVVNLVQPPSLIVTPSGPTILCQGDSVTLTASGANNYSWNTGSTNASLVVKNDGLYAVTASSVPGCDISTLIYVTVNASPAVTISPNSSTTFCQGGSVMLNAGGAGTYIWSNGGTTLEINANASGTYSVVGTDGNGCTASAMQTVTVNPLPIVTLTGLSPACVNGGPIDLNEGSPLGGIYSGLGIRGTSFDPLSAGGVGSYRIVYTYTDGNGCSNNATSSLSVLNATPAPGAITGPVTAVCKSTSATYSITPVSGATSYTWAASPDLNITGGQGTSSVTVNFSNSFTYGALSVKANGGCGSSPSSPVFISSVPAVTSAISGNANPCKRGIDVYWVKPVQGAGAYIWTVPPGSGIMKGQGTDTIVVNTGNKSGNITVRASNGCGANDSVSILSINVNCRTADPDIENAYNGNDFIMTAYPNPAHDLLNVLFISNVEDIYSLRIYDITGRMVHNEVKKAEIGDNVIQLNLNLSQGLYIVSLTLGDQNKQSKVIVE